MSETLKFGNGQWAVKEGSALAYNDENGNFKPLPFTFDRSTSATRVNKQGLIEVVSNNEPRIDFLNDSKGALKLEPSRSNYSVYSELPSTWTYTEFGSGSAGTITTGKTDMFGGTNAVQIDFPADAENVGIRFGSATSSLISGSATISLYIKLVESGSKDLQLRAGFRDVVNVNSTEFTRVDLSGTKSNNEAFNLKLRPSEGTSNGGFSIIICHPQEEQGSYPTSYIPTQGSIGTRVAESCSQTPPSGIIGQTEGTLFIEVGKINNNSVSGPAKWFMEIRKDANNSFGFSSGGSDASPPIRFVTQISGAYATEIEIPNFSNSKIAISYNSTNFKIFQNGFLRHTVNKNIGYYSEIEFLEGASTDLRMIMKNFKLYNTALTDQELINLTKI